MATASVRNAHPFDLALILSPPSDTCCLLDCHVIAALMEDLLVRVAEAKAAAAAAEEQAASTAVSGDPRGNANGPYRTPPVSPGLATVAVQQLIAHERQAAVHPPGTYTLMTEATIHAGLGCVARLPTLCLSERSSSFLCRVSAALRTASRVVD